MVLNPNTSHSHIWESFWLAQLCPLLGHIAEGFSLIHCELLGNSQQFLFKTYCRRIHCELLENSHQFLARPNLADTETSCCKRCWIFSTLLMHQHQKVLNIFSTQNVSSWFCCQQNKKTQFQILSIFQCFNIWNHEQNSCWCSSKKLLQQNLCESFRKQIKLINKTSQF